MPEHDSGWLLVRAEYGLYPYVLQWNEMSTIFSPYFIFFFCATYFAPQSDSNVVASIKYKPLYFCQFTSILSCAGSTRMPNLSLSPASWRSLSNLYSALILYPSGDNTWLVSSPPLITACRQNPSALQNRLLKNEFHTMQYALKNLIQSKFYLAISLPESEVGSIVMILVYIVL